MKSYVAGEATVGEVRSAPTGGMEGAVARAEDEWVAREDKEAPGVTVLVRSNCAPCESPAGPLQRLTLPAVCSVVTLGQARASLGQPAQHRAPGNPLLQQAAPGLGVLPDAEVTGTEPREASRPVANSQGLMILGAISWLVTKSHVKLVRDSPQGRGFCRGRPTRGVRALGEGPGKAPGLMSDLCQLQTMWP